MTLLIANSSQCVANLLRHYDARASHSSAHTLRDKFLSTTFPYSNNGHHLEHRERTDPNSVSQDPRHMGST